MRRAHLSGLAHSAGASAVEHSSTLIRTLPTPNEVSRNPSFQPENFAFHNEKAKRLYLLCWLPDNVAGERLVVQRTQNSLTILFGVYCFFVALLLRYAMFVFL
jgi:hypothetical protein